MKCKIYFLTEKEGGRSNEISPIMYTPNLCIEDSEFVWACQLQITGDTMIIPGEELEANVTKMHDASPALVKGDSFTLYEGDQMVATGYAKG